MERLTDWTGSGLPRHGQTRPAWHGEEGKATRNDFVVARWGWEGGWGLRPARSTRSRIVKKTTLIQKHDT